MSVAADRLTRAAELFRHAMQESFFRGGAFEAAILETADALDLMAAEMQPKPNGKASPAVKPKPSRADRSAAMKARWVTRKANQQKVAT